MQDHAHDDVSRVRSAPCRMGTAVGCLLAAFVAAVMPSPALSQERPIVIETEAMRTDGPHGCRVPADVRYEGGGRLETVKLVVKALSGGDELASSGLTTGNRATVRQDPAGNVQYLPAPQGFLLSENICDRMDSLEIVFASCDFGEGDVKNCLDQVRFGGADRDNTASNPRLLHFGKRR